MLNLFQHLSIQRTVEILKQVQHDDNINFKPIAINKTINAS